MAKKDKSKSKNLAAPGTPAGRTIQTLRFGRNALPLTADELAGLEERLDAHITRYATAYGFAAQLLADADPRHNILRTPHSVDALQDPAIYRRLSNDEQLAADAAYDAQACTNIDALQLWGGEVEVYAGETLDSPDV